MLDSALARPLNRAVYGEPDAADLAAAYAYGLATNHPFVDGNKRVAFIALELFLALNGHRLVIDDVNCAMCMLAVAAGTMKETALAAYVADQYLLGKGAVGAISESDVNLATASKAVIRSTTPWRCCARCTMPAPAT